MKISHLIQVVGCTIDAGAKIYAGRVDAVHGDILKMLGSMGNTEAEGENEAGKRGIFKSTLNARFELGMLHHLKP